MQKNTLKVKTLESNWWKIRLLALNKYFSNIFWKQKIGQWTGPGYMYKSAVKNDRKVIEISTILTISSSEQEANLEKERVGKFKINNIIALVFNIPKIKERKIQNSSCQSLFYFSTFSCWFLLFDILLDFLGLY